MLEAVALVAGFQDVAVVGQSVEVRGGYCFSMALDVLECARRLASNGEVTSTVALSGDLDR